MIPRLLCGLVLLLGYDASAIPAAARTCGPLKMLASANLVSQSNYLQLIPVSVNGAAKQFLLDTGGIFTQVTRRTADDLHLDTKWNATPVFNASGYASTGFAKIDTFELGGMKADNIYLRVSPSDLTADGLIAPDILMRHDVEMDFAGGKMNYFLSDHCPGKVIYWPHADVAQISIEHGDQEWIKVPVKLDGKSFTAIIDTGANSTFISTKTALDSFGLTPDSPGMEPAGNVNGDRNLASYSHIFSSLTLDGITIKNIRVTIIPDRMTNARSGNYRTKAPEFTLGMNVLKHLHLYFAFKEGKLYATAADLPSVTGTGAPPSAPKLSPAVMAALQEAQTAFKQKDYPAALAGVSKARAVAELQPLDVFMIHRFALTIHVATKDLDAAAVEAEAAADADPALVPDADKAQLYRAALQLAIHAQHYSKAAKYAKSYQATNPPSSDQQLISWALSHGDDNPGSGAPPPK